MPAVSRFLDAGAHPGGSGGYIYTAQGNNDNSGPVKANGGAVAVDGDLYFCQATGHHFTALTGVSKARIGGKRVITAGCVAGCGAIILGGAATVGAT